MRIFNFQFSIFNSKDGFSIVEMVIYIGLLFVLLTVLVDLFASSLDVQLQSTSASSIEQDGQFIVARLTRDIQNADSITVPQTDGASGNSLQISINSINYTYNVQNGVLDITNNNGTDALNGYDTTVSNFSILRLGNGTKDTVKISFTLSGKTKEKAGYETLNFQTTAGLR